MIGDAFALFTALAVSVAADDWRRGGGLPSSLRPIHYDLWLWPRFDEGSSAVFRGRVDIEVEVLSATRNVIVHYKQLNITFTALTDHTGHIIPV